MGKGWAGNRQQVHKPTWNTDTLHWTQTRNTDTKSVWTAGEYECIGWGRMYGKKLVRDWEIRFQGKQLDKAFRLSEAKNVAENHRRRYVPPELTIYAVAVKTQLDGLSFESFHVSEESAQKSASTYNERYEVGPRAEVKPIEVQP